MLYTRLNAATMWCTLVLHGFNVTCCWSSFQFLLQDIWILNNNTPYMLCLSYYKASVQALNNDSHKTVPSTGWSVVSNIQTRWTSGHTPCKGVTSGLLTVDVQVQNRWCQTAISCVRFSSLITEDINVWNGSKIFRAGGSPFLVQNKNLISCLTEIPFISKS